MHAWIDFSNAVLGGTLLFGLAALLFLILRDLVLSLRSWWTSRGARSPEEEAVDEIARYQGTFHLHEHSTVRQRFARRPRLRFDNHWACVGKWEPDE